MKKKTTVSTLENDLLVDLTFHDIPASLLSEFAKKIVELTTTAASTPPSKTSSTKLSQNTSYFPTLLTSEAGRTLFLGDETKLVKVPSVLDEETHFQKCPR